MSHNLPRNDLALVFSSDLEVSPTGDLSLISSGDYVTQRVLRRLLTNPLDYLWQPDYGAGLAAFIGQPISVPRIAAITRLQMRMEQVVALQPEPVVTVSSTDDGTVVETVQFFSTVTDDSLTVMVKPV